MRLIAVILAAVALHAQQRIVSTSPAITETLFAIGAGPRVVGVSNFCHYPPEVNSRPRVGSYLHPNIEAIVRLRPDLVIVERLPNPALEQLRSAGVRVAIVTSGSLDENLRMMETVATEAGFAEQGRKLSAGIRKQLDGIRRSLGGTAAKTVVFVVGRTPGRLEGMTAVGEASHLNELIAIAGGANMFADSAAAYPRISLETVVRLKPDVIIDMGDMAETTSVTEEHKRSVVDLWKTRGGIQSRVYAVANDIFVVPGPRMVEAAREFRALITGAVKP